MNMRETWQGRIQPTKSLYEPNLILERELCRSACWLCHGRVAGAQGPKLCHGACPGLVSATRFVLGIRAWDFPGEGELHQEPFLVQGSLCLQYWEQRGAKARLLLTLLPPSQDTEDLDHYEMKEEEPADGKKTEDEGIGKENLAILEKIKKNQRQDYLNVRVAWRAGGLGKQREPRARAMEAPASPKAKGPSLAKGTAVALRGWPS